MSSSVLTGSHPGFSFEGVVEGGYGDGFSNIDVGGAAGQIEIDHSNVEGGTDGVANMNLAPAFSDDSVYSLDRRSPCIDAGDPATGSNDPADPTDPDRALWPAQGGPRNDMGAWGGPGAVAVSDPPPTVVFVPAAASAAGSSGSFFVTDVEINNPGTGTLSYRFRWLPRDTDNSDPAESDLLTLGPGATARYRNVLGEVFDADDAVGALAISAEGGGYLVMSRTYNLTADGTFGQALPGIAADALTQKGERVRILLMAENDDSRSNLGILNGSPFPIGVLWELHASDGAVLDTGSIGLPPFGNTQLNRIFAAYAPIDAAYVDVWTPTDGAAIACYGSVVDNTSNDPTTVLPQ